MAYDELLEQRVRQFFAAKQIKHESKRMTGGLCFVVKGKIWASRRTRSSA